MRTRTKYKKGSYVTVICHTRKVKGRVEKINTQFHEPFYTLIDGSVFWESELNLDEEARDNRLKKLLDED